MCVIIIESQCRSAIFGFLFIAVGIRLEVMPLGKVEIITKQVFGHIFMLNIE